jgi:hypothetical protein
MLARHVAGGRPAFAAHVVPWRGVERGRATAAVNEGDQKSDGKKGGEAHGPR